VNPALLKLVALLVLLAGAFVAGVRTESDHRDAQLLVQERAQHAAYVDKVKRMNSRVATLKTQQQTDRNNFQNLQEELRHAQRSTLATADCPQLDALRPTGSPGTDVRLTGEFVRLWNRALRIGLPGDPGGAAAAAEGTRAAYPDDVLANHVDNAERGNECRRQLNAVIDVLQGK
jgi:hypothetical protein